MLRQEGDTPGACHEGISDTGELVSRIRSIIVEFNHQVEQAISTPRLSTYRNTGLSHRRLPVHFQHRPPPHAMTGLPSSRVPGTA